MNQPFFLLFLFSKFGIAFDAVLVDGERGRKRIILLRGVLFTYDHVYIEMITFVVEDELKVGAKWNEFLMHVSINYEGTKDEFGRITPEACPNGSRNKESRH